MCAIEIQKEWNTEWNQMKGTKKFGIEEEKESMI